MPQKYFDKFPIINYSNNNVVDITKRVALLEKVSSNPYVFYPYEISSKERPDHLSNRYYDDPYKSWMLYLTNKIVDPYYEWYLHDDEFNEFIVKKYGSMETAMTKTLYYVNNWLGSEPITISNYNALVPEEKHYWEPVYGSKNQIISYKRREIDWKMNTNKILSYAVSNTSFTNDEVVNIVFDESNTGKGQVLKAASNTVFVQHITGTHLTSNVVSIVANSYIYGQESGVNTHFSNASLLVDNIPDTVDVYWKPVTYLDLETEKNEYNKTIRVMDKKFKQTMVDNLTDLMKEE
jgi:hypothetical protein